ncbi:hypothetical protein ERJ70_16960 [Sediminibacillus dalangtanensis]|uniref:Dolichyl-phosphate-mannose-protein mannosyltransferase n=1 Tax=Sediminibacillus dalangtanensis TaxID=2729421 RepID=A0ABX7VV31_9BACI|nr:DUF6020 family protein [Sediminibacillus dalangtanensis]QTN00822.1 hypothetical protein ERJ70_16960 [Sediminibacillus dalangtanensis]
MISNWGIFLLSVLLGVLSGTACLSLIQSFTHTSIAVIIAVYALLTVFFLVGFRVMVNRWQLAKRLMRHPLSAGFISIFSLAVLFSLKGSLDHLQDNSWLIKLFVWFGSYATIFVGVTLVIFLLYPIQLKIATNSVSRWKIIGYALPCLVVWIVYLAAFYPGGMTPDSLSHWRQIHTHEFSSWHPVFYTWFMMLTTIFWHSPAATALGQIFFLAGVFGYAMYSFEKNGLKPIWLWIVTAIFALSPVNSVFSIMIWKDVLFSTFLLLFTVIACKIVVTKGEWLYQLSSHFLLGGAVIGIIFIRNNGLPVFLAMALLLMITYRNQAKRVLMTTLTVCGIYGIVTGPVFDSLEVKPADPNEALGIPTQQLARVIALDGELTAGQAEYLDRILPLAEWKEHYHPYLTDRIKFLDDYNREVIYEDYGKYFSTWFSVVSNNFSIAVDAYLKQTSLVWQINEPQHGYTSLYSTEIHQPNDYNLESASLLPGVKNVLTSWQTFTESHLKQLVWRPALYTFLIVLLTFVSFMKNGWTAWLVALPVLLNTGTILAGLPAQDFRYQYANSMALFIIGLFALLLYNQPLLKRTDDDDKAA